MKHILWYQSLFVSGLCRACLGEALSICTMSSSSTSEQADLFAVAASALEGEGPAKNIFQQIVLGSTAESVGMCDDLHAVTCNECNREVDPNLCQKVGSVRVVKKSSLYRCNDCHALQARLKRLFSKRSGLAADWTAMSKEEKRDFVARAGALKGEELENGIDTAISLSKEQQSVLHTGACGEFLPLSVWLVRGLSPDHIKSLEKNAAKRWNAQIGDYSYQFMIDSSGHTDSETTKNSTSYEPLSGKRACAEVAVPLKRGKVDEEKKAADAERKAVEAAKRQLEVQQRQKAKADIISASKVVSGLAAVLSTGKIVMTGKILLPAVSAKVPTCITMDASDMLHKLEVADASWKRVLGGEPVPMQADMQPDKINELKKAAAKIFSTVAAMVKLSE